MAVEKGGGDRWRNDRPGTDSCGSVLYAYSTFTWGTPCTAVTVTESFLTLTGVTGELGGCTGVRERLYKKIF